MIGHSDQGRTTISGASKTPDFQASGRIERCGQGGLLLFLWRQALLLRDGNTVQMMPEKEEETVGSTCWLLAGNSFSWTGELFLLVGDAVKYPGSICTLPLLFIKEIPCWVNILYWCCFLNCQWQGLPLLSVGLDGRESCPLPPRIPWAVIPQGPKHGHPSERWNICP